MERGEVHKYRCFCAQGAGGESKGEDGGGEEAHRGGI